MLLMLVLLLFLVLAFILIYYVFAPRGWFWTFVNEGTCKAVMKMGSFDKLLIQWRGRTFDRDWNVVEKEEEARLFGGLRWVGIPPFWKIYKYKFSWTGVDVNGQLTPHQKEELDYVLLMEDVYWLKIAGAEDVNLLPIDIELLVTMQVVNPYRALFKVQNWSEMVMNRLKPLFREYVATISFKDLLLKKEEEKQEIFKHLLKLGMLQEFENDYGVRIKEGGIEIKRVDPTPIEGVPSIREITLRKYIAEQDRERVLVEADAERQRLGVVAQGEKDRVKIVYNALQEFGDLGKLIRALEAIEKSPLAASLTVQAVPGLQEVLKGVFDKTPEEEMKKTLQEVIDLLKKQQQE